MKKKYMEEMGALCMQLRGKIPAKVVADSIGVTMPTISNVERNIAATEKTITKILSYFNVTYSTLLKEVDLLEKSIDLLMQYILKSDLDRLQDGLDSVLSYFDSCYQVFYKNDVEALKILIPHLKTDTYYTAYEVEKINSIRDEVKSETLSSYLYFSVTLYEITYHKNDVDKAISKITQLTEEISNKEILAESYLYISKIYFGKLNKYKSISYSEKAIKLYEESENRNKIMSAKIILSGALILCKDFSNAKRILYDIRREASSIQFAKIENMCNTNLGWLFYYEHNYDDLIVHVNHLVDTNSFLYKGWFVYLWALFKTNRKKECIQWAADNIENIDDRKKLDTLIKLIEEPHNADIEIRLKQSINDCKQIDSYELYDLYEMLITYYIHNEMLTKVNESQEFQGKVFNF